MWRATRFRQLVEENHWTVFATFSIRFQQAARDVARIDADPRLAPVTVSSRSFDRWMAGQLKRMPWPATCRVLELLFGEPAAALFSAPSAENRGPGDVATPGSAGPRMLDPALSPFRDVRVVRELLEQLVLMNRRRSALLATFDTSPSTGGRP